MSIRLIATFVIAALLFTGSGLTGPVRTASEEAPPMATEQVETPAAIPLTADQVTELKVKEDREKGALVWDVEFLQGDWEYEYEIHAETGAILKGDKEYDPPKKVETKPPVTEKPAEKPEIITAEEAKAAALAHAGLAAERVTRVKAELDREDGRLVWEVEFRFDGWEYEYEILAEDGQILHSEKERDD